MSFGCSVGDFITAIELANRIRKEFVHAPSQFKDISDEVRSLSIVLQDVEIVLPEWELTNQQKTELHNVAEGCRNVLRELNETLEKYQELDSSPKTLGRKAQRVWKRLKWEPEDIKELRSRIVANITFLNAFQGRLASQVSLATKDGVDRLHERQDDRERREQYQAILDWLTPIEYAPQQSDFISKRQEGTGEWLLHSSEFREWVNQSKQTLFCPGIPGAGKTMISSIVVDHLNAKFKNDAGIGIAYIYCNYQPQQEQRPEDLLSSLLKQFAHEQPAAPAEVKNIYERYRNKGSRPSFDEIVRALHSTVQLYSRVFIIIDALDEYHVSNSRGQKRLLSEVFSLQGQAQLNLFATSRFISEITSQFEGCMSKEIRAQDDDVLRYVNGLIPQLLRSQISKYPEYPDLRNTIRSDIVKAVDGMFLLARLHMDSLMSQPTLGHIKRALQNLPQGIKGLDETYKQAMRRIEGQEEGYRELAKQILSWVTYAKRALSTAEVQHALAVRADMVDMDEDFLPEVEILGSVCAGLITVDEKSDIIRLVHYTTREYFERTSSFPSADTDITVTCVTYLSFDTFATGFCSTDKEFETRLQSNVLCDYAARYWGHHARAASTEVEQSILDFLESESKVSASSQAMIVSNDYRYRDYSQQVPRQITGVHLAACFGLTEMTTTLLKNGFPSDCKDTYGQTPLWWAVVNGREAVVELLINRNDVEADSKDRYGRTPLSWAAENGHETVVKLLVDRADVDPDSKDHSGQTPLSWAAVNGREAVVELLVNRDDVEADSRDRYGPTPLSWAAKNGHEMVVKFLVERDDVEADSKDHSGQTPLSRAAVYGHEAVVKLLVERDDVEVDSKDHSGQTPLSRAARYGHEMVVKLLMERDDVEVDSKDHSGRTPLSRAAEYGHEAVIKLLVERDDVDPDSKDHSGQTPLSRAAEYGHEAVVKLLVERHGVDLNSKDNSGRTPLSFAAAKKQERWMSNRNYEAVVELLLTNNRVDINTKDTNGRTPLSWAAGEGQYATVKLLLAKADIDSDSKDDLGQTPLQWATKTGHEAVIELL